MLTTINTIWAPVYEKLVMGVQVLTPEWANLKRVRNFQRLSPRSITWPVQLVTGGGVALTTDGGSLARASSNSPPEATDSWIHMVKRFEAGYDALDAENDSRFGPQAIEKQIKYQAADALQSMQKRQAAGFYGTPDSILFHVSAASSNPSGTITRLTVDSLYGNSSIAIGRIRDYLTVGGDYLNVHVAETTAVRNAAAAQVVAIDETAGTIDVDSGTYFGAATALNDAVVLFNQVKSGAADDLNLGFNGMLHLSRSGVVSNINSASYPDWAAGVNVASYGSALGGADLYKWFETIEQRSGMRPGWGWTTIGAIAAAGGAELDQRRYGAGDQTMHLGFRKLNVMGVDIEGRPFCPTGFFFFGSDSALGKIAPDEDVEDVVDMAEKAGGFQQYQDTLGFYKDTIFRSQMVAISRQGLGVVSGVTEA